MKYTVLLLNLFLFVGFAEAKLFQNSYVSFEIPETWECKAFGTDWVCHSTLQGKKVEALITSTAKIASPMDSLDQYLNYLQQTKIWTNTKKEQISSQKINEAKKVFINKFSWVDSIHKNSEVKSYISRYAGTVCCEGSSSKLGILIVLSAHQDHYTKYSANFMKTVKSLRVMDIEKAISAIRTAQGLGSGSEMEGYLDGLFNEDLEDPSFDQEKSFGGLSLEALALLLLIPLAGLAYIFLKKRKKKKRSSSRRRSRSRHSR